MLSWLSGGTASALVERRKLARRECYAEVIVHIVEEDGSLGPKFFKGVVMDASVGGLKLRCYEPLAKGQRISLEFQEHLQGVWVNRVRCEVLWSYKNKVRMDTICGLSYSEDKLMMSKSWIKFVLEDIGFTPDNMQERRQSLRVKTRLEAHLVASDPALGIDMETSGTVRNMSATGCSIDTNDPILEGRRVDISIAIAKGKTLKVVGLIRGVVPNRGTRRFAHCISFEGLTPSEEKVIRGEVYKLLKAQLITG